MRCLLCAIAILLVGCASNSPNKHVEPTKAASKKVTVSTSYKNSDEVITVKGRRCRLVNPTQPKDLPSSLPYDKPMELIDILTAKLYEWAGPGGYGDKVSKVINDCTR